MMLRNVYKFSGTNYCVGPIETWQDLRRMYIGRCERGNHWRSQSFEVWN